MKKHRRRSMRKFRESDARIAEKFCTVTTVLTIALCVLFISGFLQNFWVLNFIFILGILLDLSFSLVTIVRKKTFLPAFCCLLAIVEIVALIYFAMTG